MEKYNFFGHQLFNLAAKFASLMKLNFIMCLLNLSLCSSMLPVQPTGPAISLELDVDDGEVENYEVCLYLIYVILLSLCLLDADSDSYVILIVVVAAAVVFSTHTGPPEPR